MVYNIYFEAAAMALLIVLNIYIRLQYSSDVPRNRQFKKLAFVMLIAVMLDVITAVTISYAHIVPVPVNIFLNFLYFCSDMLLEYLFVIYLMNCVLDGSKAFVNTCRVIVVLSFLLLIVNFWTGWIFTFTKEDGYVKGPVYMLVHVVPILAIATSYVLLIIGFRKFTKNQRRCIVLYIVIVASGPVVQLLHPNVLFILFTVALGFMTLTFSLETPDFQALNAAMDELRRTRDEAEEAMAAAMAADKVKSEFLSSMSHEIRTPINAILGNAETIIRETRDNGIAQYSASITSAGKTLLSIVNEIMYYTELEAGNFCLDETNYDTASFLMDIIAYGEYYTEKKGIELRMNIADNIPSGLYGDSTRLTQIFNNLMSNAAKYTDKGFVEMGITWESAENNTGFFFIYIKDTGIGMKKEDIARISNSFLRMDKEHTQNIQGIGLGLTIVTRLLSLMDSRLEVESEYGKGTTMSFRVAQTVTDSRPLKPPDAAASSRMAENDAGFTAPNAKILAVDDNMMNLELLIRSLKDTKAVISTASNGAEAVKKVENNHYDLIFMDHMMPVMDGIEALKTIRSRNLCPGVPIIVVTANAVSGERDAYLEAGFDGYISKPFTSRRLCDIMRKYLPQELIAEAEEKAEENIPAANEKEKTETGSVMEKLSFLNTEAGFSYCCNDEDFYLQIINTYLEENKSEGILEAYGEKDWENYRILVHALKGTSRTIGADYISEEARKLEFAARENNIAYIDENTERFLGEYDELLEKLRAVAESPES